MRNIQINFPLYESNYNSEFPSEQYFVILFDNLPSKFSSNDYYSSAVLDYFKNMGFVMESQIKSPKRSWTLVTEHMLVNQTKQIIITTQAHYYKDPSLLRLNFYYNISRGNIEEQLDLNVVQNFRKDFQKSSIHLVKSEMGHLDTEEYDLKVPEFDFELNYGSKFKHLHENTIVENLNAIDKSGIIIFHGDPGTGKTTYLKYLTKLIKSKDILFVPPSMAEMIAEPSIIPFLMDRRNSILLIEDGEKIVADRRHGGSASAVSNILNLTDGILGDCLNIQVIVTLNIERDKIDPALLRKGRLICEHHFSKLSVEESNRLLKYLGKNVTVTVPTSLANLYNIDVDTNLLTKPKRIGFNQDIE